MNKFILIQTPNGQDLINVDEIAAVHDEKLSFKRTTIVLKNKTTYDCMETSIQIYNKINNI